jgi:hypothetical protein
MEEWPDIVLDEPGQSFVESPSIFFIQKFEEISVEISPTMFDQFGNR